MNSTSTPSFLGICLAFFFFASTLVCAGDGQPVGQDNVQVDFGDAEGFADNNQMPIEEEEEEDVALEDSALITVNYPNEPIRNILRNVADLYDINLVIPDTLVGNASIKLRDVNWRQVFEIVLKPVGFTYGQEANVIRIVSMEEMAKEPMMLRTFPIRYAKAADVLSSLAPIVTADGQGSIQADERSNCIIARARPSALNEVERLLNESMIDKPSLQVMIETKFLEVASDINPKGNDGLGLDWWSDALGGKTEFVKVKGMLDLFNSASGSSFETVVLSASQYALTLTALETMKKSNLLGSPTLVTSNNKPASFHVGKKQPIIEANFDPTTGSYTVGSVDYIDLGVKLEVTPRVNSGADQITLQVIPEVSRINGTVDFSGTGGGLVQYPIRTIRTVKTDVNIKNGYTLALGGLMQDDDIHETKKVPLLGDLPLVGRLFQQESHTKEKINLIMFITAKTLTPEGATYHEVVDPRQMGEMGVIDANLPGYSNGIEVPGMEKLSGEHRKLLQDLQKKRHFCYESAAEQKLRNEKRSACAAPQKSRFWCKNSSQDRQFRYRDEVKLGSGSKYDKWAK